MSWYSDNERYNERPDPEYCRRCRKTEVTKETCDRCVRRHEDAESAELSKMTMLKREMTMLKQADMSHRRKGASR